MKPWVPIAWILVSLFRLGWRAGATRFGTPEKRDENAVTFVVTCVLTVSVAVLLWYGGFFSVLGWAP